jgi:hypothetical protein
LLPKGAEHSDAPRRVLLRKRRAATPSLRRREM